MKLSLVSWSRLLSFKDETGADPGDQPVGYLFLADKAAALAELKTGPEVQQQAGLKEAPEVTAREALGN
ncbi:MAG: hypothetical protein M1369_05585 [Deinococcus sp.]|nr:hypothetical protein [Deinococcus sp.]MCL5965241.1 hypothetical protein [Deinococcus sp.]